MGKVTFEFNDLDQEDIELCTHRRAINLILHNIGNYSRNLKKYEERESIPTQEVANTLDDFLQFWYFLQ